MKLMSGFLRKSWLATLFSIFMALLMAITILPNDLIAAGLRTSNQAPFVHTTGEPLATTDAQTMPPVVLTIDGQLSKTPTSAILQGKLTDIGSVDTVKVAFAYGLEDKLDQQSDSVDMKYAGDFSINVLNLKPDTTYSYQAKASSAAGEAVGDIYKFTTLPQDKVVVPPSPTPVKTQAPVLTPSPLPTAKPTPKPTAPPSTTTKPQPPLLPPLPEKVTAKVSPDKASEIKSPSQKITLKIPEKATDSNLDVEINDLSNTLDQSNPGLHQFELTASDSTTKAKVDKFKKALEISVQHSTQDLAGLDPASLCLYYLDEKTREWVPLEDSKFDAKTMILTATTNHFTQFGEQANLLQSGPGRVMAAQVNLNSGSATYNYPFELPPGPGGFQPTLQLVYNSTSTNEMKNKQAVGSWVGTGWTLSLGKISFDLSCGKYFLELNGVSYQLVTTDSTNYKTNPDEYFKITRSEQTWNVYDKGGNYYRFGGTTDSQQKSPNQQYYRWDLSLFHDINNNQATINYIQDIQGTAPNTWTRSAYPEYLKYDYVNNNNLAEIHFISSTNRPDNPIDYGTNPAPKIIENRRLDAIEVRVSNQLIRKYSFAYVTTNCVFSSDYGGIYYAGNHTLSSITQVGTDGIISLPSTSFTYQNLNISYNDIAHTAYSGNPGNPAVLTWPFLNTINSGYGGIITFDYAQNPTQSTANIWTREIVADKNINPGIGSIQTETYTYTGNPQYFGSGWGEQFRGFNQVQETDASCNTTHYYYTTGTINGKDAEKLTGKEYKTQWYDQQNVLLREANYDWSITITYQQTLGTPISGWTTGSAIGGVAADASGNVYVGVYSLVNGYGSNGSIYVYNSSGTMISGWTMGCAIGGVAVDASGNVYVGVYSLVNGNGSSGSIYVYNSSGTMISNWTMGCAIGGVAVDASGNVYVGVYSLVNGNGSSGSIYVYNSSGTMISGWTMGCAIGGVAVDASGNVYVGVYSLVNGNGSSGSIYVYNSSGTMISGWTMGCAIGGVAVDASGNVFVGVYSRFNGNGSNGSVYVYNSSGTMISNWAMGCAIGGVAVSGNVYVGVYSLGGGYGSSGQIYQYTTNMTWYTIHMDQNSDTFGPITSRIRYFYDSYGNVITEYHDGDMSASTDDSTIWRTYSPNTTANILDKPVRERTYATIMTGDNGGSNLKAETDYSYDGSYNSGSGVFAGDDTQTPVKGNLTRVDQLSSASSSVTTRYGYDSYGNKIAVKDANNNLTKWTYEATYNTYPATKTYPSVTGGIFTENYSYDPGTSNLSSQTDVNGQVTNYYYDSFKRLIKTVKPGDTQASPSAAYSYTNWGTLGLANSQNIKTTTKIDDIAGGHSLWQADYFDGLGRVIQIQAQGETGFTIISSTTVYNERGLTTKTYVTQNLNSSPTGYVTPGGSWKYTEYTYDALGRATNQLNADQTQVKTDYINPWHTLVTDQNGNKKGYYYDAFKQLVKVEEISDNHQSYNPASYSYLKKWSNSGALFAVSKDGLVYLIAYLNGGYQICKYNSDGVLQTSWYCGTYPSDITVDNNGNVYTICNGGLIKYSSTGSCIFSQYATGYSLSIDNNNNLVYVFDGYYNLIIYNTSGTYIGTYNISSDLLGSKLVIDGFGNLYILDGNNANILKFDINRNYICTINTGSQYVNGLAVDKDGYVYVSDTTNNQVKKFTSNGALVCTIGSSGSGNGQFNMPRGLGVDSSGYLYIRDSGNARYQIFSLSDVMQVTSTTNYTYDTLSNLTQVKDNANNTTTLTYDWLGHKTAMSDPDMGSWSYAYDNNGNLTSQTDARTTTTSMSYDTLNRLVAKTYPSGGNTSNVRYNYDQGTNGKGKLTGTNNEASDNLLTNSSFEEGNPPSGWSLQVGSQNRSTSQVKNGTYSLALSGSNAYTYQLLPGNYNGKTITIGAWVWASQAENGIQLTDFSTWRCYISSPYNDSQWHWITGNATVDTSLPLYFNNFLFPGNSAVTYFDGAYCGENFLANSSFEDGNPPSGWDTYGQTLSQDATIKRNGNASLKEVCTISNGGGSQFISNYTNYLGKTISYGCWVYSPSSNTGNPSIRIYDGINVSVEPQCTTKDTWVWLTTTLNISQSATYIRIELFNRTLNDVAYFDDAFCKVQANLLTNSSFESGDPPTDWHVNAGSWVRSSANPEVGAYSLQGTRSGTDASLYWIQATSVYSNKTLTFGCWVKTSQNNQVRLQMNDGITNVFSDYIAGDNSWHYVTITQTFSPVSTQLVVVPRIDNVDGTAYFDGAYCKVQPNLLSNSSFESGDPPTGWSLFNLTSAERSTAQVKIGTYSAKITGTTGSPTYYQAVPLLVSYQGRTFTLGSWVYSSIANSARLCIYDGVSEHFSNYHTGNSTWQWLTVTATISNSATLLRGDLHLPNGTDIAYIDGAYLFLNDSSDSSYQAEQASDPSYYYAYQYDTRGRMTQEVRTIDSVAYNTSYTYDGADRNTTITYPAVNGTRETVTNYFNDRGLPNGLSGSVAGTLIPQYNVSYNQFGQIKSINLGNGIQTTYGYYGLDGIASDTSGHFYGKLYEIKSVNGATVLQDVQHTWDAAGNLTQRLDVHITGSPVTENFSYDYLDRLTGVTGAYSESFTYDALGNILTKTDGGTTRTYTYGSSKPHAVTSITNPSVAYSYDDNGNMNVGSARTWDAENRLTSITKDGVTTSYVYDGDGKRIKQTVGSVATVYVNQYYEFTGSVVTTSYYLGSKLIAQRKGSGSTFTLSYIHQDSLNSSSVTTTSAGTEESRISYLPLGGIFSSSGSMPTDKKFTGQRLDSTGLYYYGARYYDSEIGRFISADTVVPNFANPQSLNRYSYCLNNPLKYTDPSGHEVDINGYDVRKLYSDLNGYVNYGLDPDQSFFDTINSHLFQAYDFYRQHDIKTFSALENSIPIINATRNKDFGLDFDSNTPFVPLPCNYTTPEKHWTAGEYGIEGHWYPPQWSKNWDNINNDSAKELQHLQNKNLIVGGDYFSLIGSVVGMAGAPGEITGTIIGILAGGLSLTALDNEYSTGRISYQEYTHARLMFVGGFLPSILGVAVSGIQLYIDSK